jgi:hypothetical protein
VNSFTTVGEAEAALAVEEENLVAKQKLLAMVQADQPGMEILYLLLFRRASLQ